MANPDRKGGGGLSLQTLVIASAASLTAAMVTARLFPPGTIYASALTPVIVAAVSEMLHRPAARATAIREQRRTMVLEARERHAARVPGSEPSPLRGAPDFATGAGGAALGTTNGSGAAASMRVHGRSPSRRIHPKVWVATGLAGFAIAVAVLTLPELILGGAVATRHRTTFFGGGGGTSTQKQQTKTQTQTGTQTAPKTVTQTVPAQTPTDTAPTGTATTPTDTQTTPTDTQTTPTGTSTAPAPGGVPPPP
jgi:hypothetical protein